MQHLKVVTLVSFFALATVIAGCGGGGSSNSNTSTAASPTPTSVIHAEQNALPLAVAAKIPAGLKCSSQDIVWVNMHTKAFHDPGDPYYGKTKNGAYMCRADAIAQGDHPAGARHSHMNSSTTEATAAPEATATPRHRRHHGGD
ncbi:MAG: hypothetical protein JO219_11330 [Candidatus Eremiobacteraeota bacterium]|nr:hypothetical protein [Candidatus Eremiobacteraeota bacterium]MBV8365106.1 hypothetical protein [Candidatus Eremiobacteraeota bacterium]